MNEAAFTNLDIAADEAFARAEDAATAANRTLDRDSFIAGYRARAEELKDGPWHNLIELSHELRAYAVDDTRSYGEIEVVRFIRVPADLVSRLQTALVDIDARESEDAEPLEAVDPTAPVAELIAG